MDNRQANFLIDYQNKNKVILTTEKLNNYLTMLNVHKSFEIPFTDHKFYNNLLQLSKNIVHNEDLESWNILDQYIELNIENIDKNFLVEAVQGFGKVKYFKFKFWYYCENKIMENMKNYSTEELSKIVYSFSFANKGSDYFYLTIAEELTKRKISKLSNEEFILIYNAYKHVNIKDKVFNLILVKAREEKFNHL